MKKILPPFLKPNSTIGVCCPSGFVAKEDLVEGMQFLQDKGFQVLLGPSTQYNSDNYFSAPDALRLQDVQKMLDDKNIDCLLFGRGGYGMSRIIDQLDWTTFSKHPKWICGFSDITLLLTHINTTLPFCCVHSPMLKSLSDKNTTPFCQNYFIDFLQGKINTIVYAASNMKNKIGHASGELIGGNLSLLCHSIGSVSELQTDNKILFIEDVDERLYEIDRLFLQLLRAKKIACLKGLIVGGFSSLSDTTRPFGQTLQDIILSHCAAFDFPIAFDFPVGHQAQNTSLMIGGEYALAVQTHSVELKKT